MRRLALAAMGLCVVTAVSASAQATCIENRSDRTIAFVRGTPFAGMTQFYQGMVEARGFLCAPMPVRADGTTPVSIYVIDSRGRCQVARGCYYENGDALNVFVGMGADGCPAAFEVVDCPSQP